MISAQKPIRQALIVVLLALSIAGCQRALDIGVAGTTDELTISFSRPGLPGAVGMRPEIAEVEIYEVPRTGTASDAWAITSISGCQTIEQPIRYGIVPDRFRQRVEPRALKEQALYRVQSVRCGYVGFVHFEINDGRVQQLTWDEVQAREQQTER